MKAGHACSACLAAAGVQGASVLAINELTQEAMEFAFEYSLKAAKHKITAGRCVDEKVQVVRNQQFGERGDNADEAVTVAVDQRGYELLALASDAMACSSDPCIDVAALRWQHPCGTLHG